MTETTVVQAVADPKSLELQKQNTAAFSSIAEWSTAERSDEAIYREACLVRMGLANKTYADLPAVLKYAEAYLAAIRARFPREAEPVSPVSNVPAVA